MVPTSAYAKIWEIFLAKSFFDDKFPYEGKVRMAAYLFEWWALGDDLRTLPLGQIVAGLPHIEELSLL